MIEQVDLIPRKNNKNSVNISKVNKEKENISKKRRSILIVDDAETIRFFLKTTLVSEGFDVFEADTAVNGFKKLDKESIDLVILDLGLPDMDGLEMLETLNYDEPNLPVIIFTVRDDRETKDKAFRFGARDYITKPFDIEVILDSIAVILDCNPDSKK